MYIRKVYATRDGLMYGDFYKAWDAEKKRLFPNIILIGCDGDTIDTSQYAGMFIVNTQEEAKFVSELIAEREYYLGNIDYAVPGSLITYYNDDMFCVYPPAQAQIILEDNKCCYSPDCFLRQYYKV